MNAFFRVVVFVVGWIGFSACSVEISQTQIIPTRPPATSTDTPTHTPVTPTATVTLTPSPTQPDDPTPTITASPTSTPAFVFSPVEAPELDIEILPDATNLDITGRIAFLHYDEEQGQSLVVFDLSAGEVWTIFHAPSTGYLTSFSFSPNREQIIISYAPPPSAGQVQSGFADLYLLTPEQGDTPQLFLERTEEFEGFYSAYFTPDQESVYYLHYFEDASAPSGARYTFDRMAYPEGESAIILPDNPFYPRLSPDGTQLAYVIYDLVNNGPDTLFVTDAEGNNPVQALDSAEFPFVDAPFFSPDNQYLYFGAVIPDAAPPPLAWWEVLLGVQIAFAHPVPSDFFRTSLVDGTTERITELLAIGMVGTFSPEGEWIGFIANSGLYVMRPDGSDLIHLLESPALYGNVEWIP